MSDIEDFTITNEPLDGTPVQPRWKANATWAMKRHLEIRHDHLDECVLMLEHTCQSPIEVDLGVAMLATDLSALMWSTVIRWNDQHSLHDGFYIVPQFPVGKFRLDFGLILIVGQHRTRLAVECDGHEFHERDRKRAAKDKSRDRELLEADWPVMRFTGSEIHKDPEACARQAVDHLMRMIDKQRRAKS